MLKSNITDPASGKSANIAPSAWGNALCVTNFNEQYGHFKAATRASAGTTTITEPSSGGSISLTDLIVTAERRSNGGVLTIRFTDGTNTVNIAVIDVTDAPAYFGLPFNGRWQGWTDARLEMVTVEAFDATVSVGYVKIDPGHTLAYQTWNEER